MFSDFWFEGGYIAKVRALEQQKYRQGYRNDRDLNGSETYVATPTERVQFLALEYQQRGMQEAEALERVKTEAAPYQLAIGVDGGYYKASIKNAQTGEFATRRFPKRNAGGTGAGEEDFIKAVQGMKQELEAKSQPPQPMPKVWLQPEPKTEAEKFNEKVLKSAAKEKPMVKVTDKRAGTGTGKPLACPDHGNPMVPAEEVGVLKCPVLHCIRVARKKSAIGAGLKKTDLGLSGHKDIATVDEVIVRTGSGKTAGEITEEVIRKAFPAEVPEPQLPMSYFIKSDTPVRLFIAPDGRMYLHQTREGGSATAIDITSAMPNFTRNMSRFGPAEITLTLNIIRD